MKLNLSLLKFSLIQLAGGLILLVVFLSLVSCWLEAKKIGLSRDIQTFKKKVSEYKELVSGFQMAQKLSQDNQKMYEYFLKSKFTEPLDKKDLRQEIGSLAHLNDLQNLHLKFGSQKPYESSAQTNLVIQQVSIECEALWDKDFFAFLMCLPQQCPGFVEVTFFSIKRLATISPETVEKIAQGDRPSLFHGEVTLAWIHVLQTERPEQS